MPLGPYHIKTCHEYQNTVVDLQCHFFGIFCFCHQDPLTVNPNTGLIKAALHSSFNPDHHKGKWSAAAMD